jgi:hypothetical protein
MTTILGTWDLSLATPIGSISARYTFVEAGGERTGTATSPAETVPLTDIQSESGDDGERVTWHQRISKPMRLDLAFDVLVVGDELSGRSRAGRLPASRVSGRRLLA